ncbi:MAG: hypothetical protein V4475_01920 [Pseudomonadota bacterium]
MSAGCAHRVVEVETPRPVPVAVVVKDPPPAELLRCAVRPEGFPASQAVIPPGTRAAIVRLAKAFAGAADQLDRLIDWNKPGTCTPTPARP